MDESSKYMTEYERSFRAKTLTRTTQQPTSILTNSRPILNKVETIPQPEESDDDLEYWDEQPEAWSASPVNRAWSPPPVSRTKSLNNKTYSTYNVKKPKFQTTLGDTYQRYAERLHEKPLKSETQLMKTTGTSTGDNRGSYYYDEVMMRFFQI